MRFDAVYNYENDEYEIYICKSQTEIELFCHLSASDFEIFKQVTMVPVLVKLGVSK